MDALDAFEAALELELVFADLGLEGAITARSHCSASRLAISKVRRACTATVSKNFWVRACFSVVTMVSTVLNWLLKALEALDLLLSSAGSRRRLGAVSEAVLDGEALVHGVEHLGDLGDLVGGFAQVAAQVLEEALHGLAQPAGEGRVEHRLAGAAGLIAHRASRPRWPNRLLDEVGEHAAHRVVLLQALLELVLLGRTLRIMYSMTFWFLPRRSVSSWSCSRRPAEAGVEQARGCG